VTDPKWLEKKDLERSIRTKEKHSTEEYAKWDISKYKHANVTTHKEVVK